FQTQAAVLLAQGVTTAGADLSQESLGMLQKLNAQGRLPVRVAYMVDAPVRDLPASNILWKIPRSGAVSHCLAMRKEEIAHAKEVELAFSCEPPLGVHLEDGTKPTDTESRFGRQEGGDMRSPFRSLIDAGLRLSLGTNSLNYYSFLATQQLVVRAF